MTRVSTYRVILHVSPPIGCCDRCPPIGDWRHVHAFVQSLLFSMFQIRVVNAFRAGLDTRYDSIDRRSLTSNQSYQNLTLQGRLAARKHHPANTAVSANSETQL